WRGKEHRRRTRKRQRRVEELHAPANQYDQLFGRAAARAGDTLRERMMSTAAQSEAAVLPAEKQFDWPVCYPAEEFITRLLEEFLARNSFARTLAERMRDETGTLLLDW